MKSNCCKATMTTVSGGEGTGYWKCRACNEPCDPVSENLAIQSPELSSLGKVCTCKPLYTPKGARTLAHALGCPAGNPSVDEFKTVGASPEKECTCKDIAGNAWHVHCPIHGNPPLHECSKGIWDGKRHVVPPVSSGGKPKLDNQNLSNFTGEKMDKASGDTKELCACGFPQSSPIPHKHSIPESSSDNWEERFLELYHKHERNEGDFIAFIKAELHDQLQHIREKASELKKEVSSPDTTGMNQYSDSCRDYNSGIDAVLELLED